METLTIEHANALPAPTWHRLGMNDVDIELPVLEAAQSVEVQAEEGLLGEAGAFEEALAAIPFMAAGEPGDQPVERAADSGVSLGEPASLPTSAAHQVDDQESPTAAKDEGAAIDEQALSAFQVEAFESRYLSAADVFSTGMGPEASEYLEYMAGEPIVFVTRPGERTCATVRVEGVDGAANAAAIDVVAAPGSFLSLAIGLDSPEPGAGVVGTRLRVFAGADARVDVVSTQTLDDGWIALDDAGIVIDERARVQLRHTVLGAGRAYTGLAADLRGDDARLDIDTRYLGHAHETRDFNYVTHQRGRRTVCNLDANGVLAGESVKTLRSTIELVHGCKGSEGSEQETVLLADERVVNRTVPVILCDEDDVAGNHGATIGHVAPKQLFYLASRGISPDDAERLFITAAFEEAALTAPDPCTRAAVGRLAAQRGVRIEEAVA